MLKNVIPIVLLFFVLNISDCMNYPGRTEYSQIIKLPTQERLNKFVSYPVDKQIDIYLFAMCCVEPSNTSFLDYLRANGESKIINIVNRIEKSESQRDKANLMRILVSINKDCKCLSASPSIIEVLINNKSEIDQENDETGIRQWKILYIEYLDEIKSNN